MNWFSVMCGELAQDRLRYGDPLFSKVNLRIAVSIASLGLAAQATAADLSSTPQTYQEPPAFSFDGDYIRVGGKAVEGSVLPVGPVVVAEQLPDDHPSKATGVQYTKKYETENGKGSVSAFGGMMYDAGQLVAAAIPGALKKGAPGTQEFRTALRDGLENQKNVVSVNGVYNTSPTDHFGHDERSRVLITVTNGEFRYLPMK